MRWQQVLKRVPMVLRFSSSICEGAPPWSDGLCQLRRFSRRALRLSTSFAILCLRWPSPTNPQPQSFVGGGPGGGDFEVLDQFDADENGWLDRAERKDARIFVQENRPEHRGPGGPVPGGPGFIGPVPGGPGFGGPDFGPPPGFGPP